MEIEMHVVNDIVSNTKTSLLNSNYICKYMRSTDYSLFLSDMVVIKNFQRKIETEVFFHTHDQASVVKLYLLIYVCGCSQSER